MIAINAKRPIIECLYMYVCCVLLVPNSRICEICAVYE